MKKIVIILIFLILITGCKQKININEQIINIKYENHIIKNNDYQSILEKLQQINFYCGKKNNYNDKSFSISTTNSVIKFTLSNNYYMEFQKDNKYCYTKDTEKVKNLIFLLEGITKRYTNSDFYKIEFIKNYSEDNLESIIRLDKENDYIIIDFKKEISDFKINEIEFNNDNFEEINLLYSKESIDTDKIVIRKQIYSHPSFKISFKNEYDYTFHITPIYDGITGNVVFDTKIK